MAEETTRKSIVDMYRGLDLGEGADADVLRKSIREGLIMFTQITLEQVGVFAPEIVEILGDINVRSVMTLREEEMTGVLTLFERIFQIMHAGEIEAISRETLRLLFKFEVIQFVDGAVVKSMDEQIAEAQKMLETAKAAVEKAEQSIGTIKEALSKHQRIQAIDQELRNLRFFFDRKTKTRLTQERLILAPILEVPRESLSKKLKELEEDWKQAKEIEQRIRKSITQAQESFRVYQSGEHFLTLTEKGQQVFTGPNPRKVELLPEPASR